MIKIVKVFCILIACFTSYIHAKGTLKIKSNINDAYIYLNGKKKAMLGEGITSLSLKEGEYLIEIRKTSKDTKYIYKGAKSVFVGDDTSSLINIPTKKHLIKSNKNDFFGGSDTNEIVNFMKKEKALEKFISQYYSNIHRARYTKNFLLITNNYKKTKYYSNYLKFWRDEIKQVSILDSSPIKMNEAGDRANIRLLLGLQKHNLDTFCTDNMLSFVYKGKWLLDSQNSIVCKPFIIEKRENTSSLKVEYPPFYVKDEYLKIKVTLTNFDAIQKGGVSVSFPTQEFSKRSTLNDKVIAKDLGSTFENIKFHRENSKAWNKTHEKSQKLKYFLYEGWTNKWGKDRSKVLYFTIKPRSNRDLFLYFRSMLIDQNNNNHSNPSYGLTDQQGYSIFQVHIPIFNIE